jgi:hypothetical protein
MLCILPGKRQDEYRQFSIDPRNTPFERDNGRFLALAYFGTDQSQVGRYLSGRSVRESQMGLIMNGLLKVPMQFFILLTGVMVLSFPIQPVPLNFNPNNKVSVYNSSYKAEYQVLEQKLDALSEDKKVINLLYIDQLNQDYDNPILRKELIALSAKKRLERQCQGNYSKSR